MSYWQLKPIANCTIGIKGVVLAALSEKIMTDCSIRVFRSFSESTINEQPKPEQPDRLLQALGLFFETFFNWPT